MTTDPEPIRKGLLPCTPPAEWEFHTVYGARTGSDGCALFPGDTGPVVIRRRVSYGDWEPVRPDHWAEEPSAEASAAAAVPVAAPPTTEQTALRERIADAIRAAACPGSDCPLTEAECSEQRIQPAAWERGVLSEVYGRPEWFADVVLAVLPAPADRAATLREAATRYEEILVNADTGHDPRYWTAVRDITLGLRAMAAEAPRRSDVGTEFVQQIDHPDTAGLDAVDADLAAEAPHTATPDEEPPVCEGFVWIGQSFATCDRCGQPAWDHEGEEVAAEGAGPFDNRRTVRPWKPGQADAIRAKWGPPAVVAQPGKETSS
ncbi:hypothetical protein PV728_48045 [Streptomyces europaeiscabiei]|uniref:hypothetical protein n=1 Tax=Streptomyces europaeiscabiei TaxID=146819 RepID=UPI0029BBA889|nr:hypothetical protein [Streptomyces europaeiscabiei]MDX3637803.1 hypothetical protein [Streptomyces europaeiscabiei]MDX3655615.1 hypothetical protein [Streptomyces europaeiscabiei]